MQRTFVVRSFPAQATLTQALAPQICLGFSRQLSGPQQQLGGFCLWVSHAVAIDSSISPARAVCTLAWPLHTLRVTLLHSPPQLVLNHHPTWRCPGRKLRPPAQHTCYACQCCHVAASMLAPPPLREDRLCSARCALQPSRDSRLPLLHGNMGCIDMRQHERKWALAAEGGR